MTTPEKRAASLWPPIRIFQDYEQLERALKEADTIWIDDFIKRLNYAVKEIDRKK
jgi:hypothetical protein